MVRSIVVALLSSVPGPITRWCTRDERSRHVEETVFFRVPVS